MAETDVVVVGAGPTGLTVACQLASRGVRCRVIDQLTVRSDKSRANAVQARTLELLDKLELAEPLIAKGRPIENSNFYSVRGRVARLEFAALGITDTRYPFVLFVSQCDTEQVLETRLRELGVQVEYGTALTALEQNDAGAVATIRRADGEERVACQYVIGADGAHSMVRKLAGLAFVGGAYAQDFILCDAEMEWDLTPGETHIFWSRDGVFSCFSQGRGNEFRLVVTRARGASTTAEPSLVEVEDIVRRMTSRPARIVRSQWLARFSLHHRAVQQYRKGRVFLAGDAAHIHSPAGGQGMNTGIQDAFNLGWKLAAALRGQARPSVLNTYDDERHPIGRKLLETTDRLFNLGSTANPILAEGRHWFAARIASLILNSSEGRLRAFRFLAQFGIRYRRSALSWSAPELGRWNGGPQAGDRAPDVLWSTGAAQPSLHAMMRGPSWFLLRFHGTGPVVADPIGPQVAVPLEVIELGRDFGRAAPSTGSAVVDVQGAAHRAYGIEGSGWYLIRPDGHVACRGFGSASTQVQRYLELRIAPENGPDQRSVA